MATVYCHLALIFCIFLFSPVHGAVRSYDFKIQYVTITRLGTTKSVISVNGMFPGPTVYANEGDRVLVRVTNNVNVPISIHWHGVRQFRTGWADGPAYITQCPMKPGTSYLYNFTIDNQRGTLFWHAHFLWLRSTVYGAIVTYPRQGTNYPFQFPDEEHVIILGEWWNQDVLEVEKQGLEVGLPPKESDAYTLNGLPGPLYEKASQEDVYRLHVIFGKTYLLRIINAALNVELFFNLANHVLNVVEMDAMYTKSYLTETIMLAPGQSVNVIVTAAHGCGVYYMTATPYVTAQVPYTKTPGAGLFIYDNNCGSDNSPVFPNVPDNNDTEFATRFTQNIKSLGVGDYIVDIPQNIDISFFIAMGLAVKNCAPGRKCFGINGGNFSASMNNISFVLPKVSILEAAYHNIPGIYSTEFPQRPIQSYDYTGGQLDNLTPFEGTYISEIPFNANVQIILQDTSAVAFENHPVHLHGYNFYEIGLGFGNYNPQTSYFNLVDPPMKNTIAVPAGGWAAIRFKADNPGVWYMHCHLEVHTTWGLATAFLVKNGRCPAECVIPPPKDLPQC